MAKREMSYTVPDFIRNADDRVGALAMFVLKNTGSVHGEWVGRMSATDQRALFGRMVGKGRISVDGSDETVSMSVTTGYTGHLRDTIFDAKWASL